MKELAQKFFEKRNITQRVLLNIRNVEQIAIDILTLLYPQFHKKQFLTLTDTLNHLEQTRLNLEILLRPLQPQLNTPVPDLTNHFFSELIEIGEVIEADSHAIFEGDPAAKSLEEVILCYPGFTAIAIFRIAHFFYQQKVPVFSRMLTEYAHQLTGIDIHPGATIGSGFCIDHGTGIVIGETTQIGPKVKIYQGVTLGALSVVKDMANKRRHPTIEENSIIYSNATILGGETRIGHDSIIGGNVWLTESVPPNSLVYSKNTMQVRSTSDKTPLDFCI